MTRPVLLTGFEPFGKHAVNSSWEAARLVGEQLAPHVLARRLPVDYRPARTKLLGYLTRHKPFICLCTGLTSAPAFSIERQARKPAQFGRMRGAALLEGAWPWEEMAAQLQAAGCPAEASCDAGQYVCESTYWSLLAFRERHGYPAYAGFIHVPPLCPDLTAETIAAALASVIRARLEDVVKAGHEQHRRGAEGAEGHEMASAPSASPR